MNKVRTKETLAKSQHLTVGSLGAKTAMSMLNLAPFSEDAVYSGDRPLEGPGDGRDRGQFML